MIKISFFLGYFYFPPPNPADSKNKIAKKCQAKKSSALFFVLKIIELLSRLKTHLTVAHLLAFCVNTKTKAELHATLCYKPGEIVACQLVRYLTG
jgi:hypothetical protein